MKAFSFFFFPVAALRRSSRLSVAVLPLASPSSSSLSPRRVTRQTPGRGTALLLHTPAQQPLTPRKTPAKAQKSQPGTPQLSCSTRSSEPPSSSLPVSVAEEVSEVVSHEAPAAACQAPDTSPFLSFTLSPCGTPTPGPASFPPTTMEAGGSACCSAETSVVEVKMTCVNIGLFFK